MSAKYTPIAGYPDGVYNFGPRYDDTSTRASSRSLDAPAPDEATLNEIPEAALRAPDHAALRPWRILVLRGEAELEAPPTEAPLPEIPDEELRSAMKAYRKRLKLIKLDHESKLGHSPLSTGKGADFESIIPPEQWAPEVWKVLAAKGELESTGQGFYKLPDVGRSF